MTTENTGNELLCSRTELTKIKSEAELQKEKILKEFKQFYAGDIDIKIHSEKHPMGWSVAATLTVNGETCREYPMASLCFLELNEIMLKRIMQSRCANG